MGKNWPFFVIILLLILLLLKDVSCNEGTKQEYPDTLSHSTVKEVDSSEVVSSPSQPPKIVIVEKPVPYFLPRDTNYIKALLDSFFTAYKYSANYRDSSIDITFTGDLQGNSIHNPAFTHKILRPTVINTTTLLAPDPVKLRNKMYVGLFVSVNKMVPAIGAVASFQNKRDNIITVGYGTGPTYMAGMQWKIRLKK